MLLNKTKSGQKIDPLSQDVYDKISFDHKICQQIKGVNLCVKNKNR